MARGKDKFIGAHYIGVKFLDGKYATRDKEYFFKTYILCVPDEKVIVDTRYGFAIGTVTRGVSEVQVRELLGNIQIKEVVSKCNFGECIDAKKMATDIAMLRSKLHMTRRKFENAMQHDNVEKAGEAAKEYCETNIRLKNALGEIGEKDETCKVEVKASKLDPCTAEAIAQNFCESVMLKFMTVD